VNGVATAHEYLFTHFGSGRRLDEVATISLRHELQLRLSELLLMRVDKMTMAASVEARAPFLDHRLVEFAARLPIGMHWRPGAGKLVLKAALAGIVPQAVLARPKQGFGAPVWRWMKSLRAVAERELFRDPITAYLDAGAMRKLLDGPATTRRGFELWVLLNFALWHRHWIEGEELDEVRSIAVAQVSS
jgi:asparagine synthase (glutamine-hydrolysing)